MWTERQSGNSVDRRDRSSDLVEQFSRPVLCRPSMDVVPVQSLIALHCNDVADVVEILSPLCNGVPPQFHHNDILRAGNHRIHPKLLGGKRSSPLKSAQIVGVLAKEKQLNFKVNRRDSEVMPHGAGHRLEGSLSIQFKVCSKRFDELIERLRIDCNHNVRILCRSRNPIRHARKTSDNHIGNPKSIQRCDHHSGRFKTIFHSKSEFLNTSRAHGPALVERGAFAKSSRPRSHQLLGIDAVSRLASFRGCLQIALSLYLSVPRRSSPGRVALCGRKSNQPTLECFRP